jgi:hypothetical protein
MQDMTKMSKNPKFPRRGEYVVRINEFVLSVVY